MAADSSWSLRGVDPRAREAAREAAKREGMTIGEWLNRQLLEEGDGQSASSGDAAGRSYDDAEALASVLERLSRRIEAAEHRSTLAITNIDQSVLGVISRIEGAQELQSEFADRYSAALSELRDTQAALTARIERMERSGGDADSLDQLRTLQDALGKLAKQVHDGEAEARARFEALRSDAERSAKRSGERIDQVSRALDDRIADVTRKVESDLSGIASVVAREVDDAARKVGREVDATTKRLDADMRAVRDDGARTRRDVEALINDRAAAGRTQIEALESAVTDVNSRLVSAERDTDRAIKALQRSFSELDARVRQSKTGDGTDREAFVAAIERRFEGLSREIADTISATRAEIAAKMVNVARQDGAPAVVAELEVLGRRLGDAEAKQRVTLERISGEVAKLAGAVEARVRKSETAAETRVADLRSALAAAEETPAAQAAEIARLHARLKSAETKSAAAVDVVTRRVDALDERLGGAEPAEDLPRRIRDSEERTRAMINGALADINRRLDHSDDQIASALSPVQRALDALRMRLEALEADQDGAAPRAAGRPASRPTPTASPANLDDPLDFSGSFDIAGAGDDDIELDAGDLTFESEAEPQPTPSARRPVDASPDRRPGARFVADVEDERGALEGDEDFTLDIESLEPREADSPVGEARAVEAPLFEFESKGELADDGVFDLVYGRSVEDADDESDAAPRTDKNSRGSDDLDDLDGPDSSGDFDPFAEDAPGTAPPKDFMKAAREAARQAAARPAGKDDARSSAGFGPVETPASRTKKGRGLLFAAGGLAFLAVGAAGVIVLRDSARLEGEIEAVGADPLGGLFVAPPASSAAGDPLAAVAPRYVAAEDGLDERGVAVDLDGLGGQDFSLYVAGDDLYNSVRPEEPSAGAALDALLARATAPVSATPEPEAVELAPPAPATDEPSEALEPAGAAPEPAAAIEPADALPVEPASAEEAALPDEAAEAVIPPVMTLEEAAAQGDPVAQFELGESLLDRDQIADGTEMIVRSAETGLPAAQYRLGKLYETGRGMTQDLTRARGLLETASEAGHRNAMHSLGILYAEGRGGPQNFEAAARWFEEAALLGATDAQFNLAVLYEQGLGVPVSLPDAYAWFAIAARAGDVDAGARADAVATELAPDARERADEAVRRFSPRPLDEASNGVFRDTPWTAAGPAPSPRMARIQEALAILGYDPGPADGLLGGQTITAIRDYQADNGLTPTGAADDALLEQLEAEAGF